MAIPTVHYIAEILCRKLDSRPTSASGLRNSEGPYFRGSFSIGTPSLSLSFPPSLSLLPVSLSSLPLLSLLLSISLLPSLSLSPSISLSSLPLLSLLPSLSFLLSLLSSLLPSLSLFLFLSYPSLGV